MEDTFVKVQDEVDLHGDKVIDMKEAVDKQNASVEEMFNTLTAVSIRMSGVFSRNEKQADRIKTISHDIEEAKELNLVRIEKVRKINEEMGQELSQNKVKDIKRIHDFSTFRFPFNVLWGSQN